MKQLLLISILGLSSLWGEAPWGKDQQLVRNWKSPKEKSSSAKTWYLSFIDFHQQVLSKADGPRSHFYPSSSEYTKQAMKKYGFFKGCLMGMDRLMRENKEDWDYPLYYGYKEWRKYHPVK